MKKELTTFHLVWKKAGINPNMTHEQHSTSSHPSLSTGNLSACQNVAITSMCLVISRLQ